MEATGVNFSVLTRLEFEPLTFHTRSKCSAVLWAECNWGGWIC